MKNIKKEDNVEAHVRVKGINATALKSEALSQKRSIANLIEYIISLHYEDSK